MKLAKYAVLGAVATLGLTAGAAMASEPPWMNSPAQPAATVSEETILIVPAYYGQDEWGHSYLIFEQPDLG